MSLQTPMIAVERMDMLVGNTPMVQLRRVGNPHGASIFVKLEQVNPSGSIRDRYMAEILERSVDAGQMVAGDSVALVGVDDSAVAAALLGGLLQLKVCLFAPKDASERLVPLLRRFGVKITYTLAQGGMKEAVKQAAAWARQGHDRFYIDAFRREAICDAYSGIAAEILRALHGRTLGAFITSVSTGGTFREVAPRLRRSYPALCVGGAVLVDAELEGLAKSPQDFLQRVTLKDAWRMRDHIAQQEGLLLGVKGAACIILAMELQQRLPPDEVIVALNPDAGQRYLGWEDRPLFPYAKVHNPSFS